MEFEHVVSLVLWKWIERISYNIFNQDFTSFLYNEEGQRISRQTALPLRYPVNTQCLTHTNQADPHRPMFEYERLDVTQQLPELLKLHLRILVDLHKFTLTERELLNRRERAVLVKTVMNVWGLGEVELGINFRPIQARAAVGFNF